MANQGYEGSLILDSNARKQLKSTTENIINFNGVGRQPGNFKFGATPPIADAAAPIASADYFRGPLPKHDGRPVTLSPATPPRTTPIATPPVTPPARQRAVAPVSTTPTATPVKPVGIAGGDGSGFAVVGGKRTNYQDIGTRRDPLAQRRDGIVTTPDGGTMLLGNQSAYRPRREDEGAAAARGIADFTPQEHISRNNERIQDDLATITANMGNMYDGDQKVAAAKMRIAALQGQNALLQQGIAGDQTLEGHKYVADAGIAAHRIAGDAQVSAARLAVEGREREAQEKLTREQQERQDKAQQEAATQQRKDVRDVLTNGYGVAPTPQAIKSYLSHQKKLEAWDGSVTKWLAAHAKANPDQAAAVKDALIAYHRNPKDPAAIESVRAARNLLSGGGRGSMPQWFEDALQMPVFNTSGLQSWKQSALMPEGVSQ